jgi:oligogalacturonide lyase
MSRLATISLTLLAAATLATASDAGRDWGVERRSQVDPVTGVPVWTITANKGVANSLYIHFPNFTRDSRHLLFSSDRTGAAQIYRMDMATGHVVQITDGAGVGGTALVPDPGNPQGIFYMRGDDVMALDVVTLAERKLGTIPPSRFGGVGQPSVSATGEWLAVGRQIAEKTWEVGLFNTRNGSYKVLFQPGFRIGHVQHSPTEAVTFFVWETSGFAPQRSWLVNDDGTNVRPFYARPDRKDWFTPLKEWMTHEAWIQNTGEMTMINDKVGIVIVNTDGSSRLVREGSFWHAQARPDGKFIVADDFDGRLWLIESATGNARLLATGLRKKGAVHLHPAFDWKGRYVVFNITADYQAIGLIDLNDLPAQKWQ